MSKKINFKKVFIGLGIFLFLSITALAAIPFLFKDKIQAMVLKAINENVDAKVAFENVDLSLFKSFPNANVTIDKLSIINKAPFEGDTLFYSGELNLKMSIKELFKDENEPMNLQGFSSENAVVNIIFNKDGLGNFDIALKNKDEEDKKEESKPFALNIQEYAIKNMHFTYLDEGSNMKMVLDSINHDGTGNFASQILDLDTQTTAKLSFEMEKTNYMNNVAITLDAVLGIDLDKMKFQFKENKALINQLPLEFDGFVQMVDAGQVYDLKFNTPTSSFTNFLGLIPEAYSGDIKKVKTTGDFTVNGKVNGELTETTIPKFNIEIASNNASFQYPDLPKSVKNIIIDTHIVNETGLMNDTYVNLDKLSFTIDQDVFNIKANVRNFDNALVNAELKGIINLANVTKAYPVQLDKPLTGILKADVVTKFDMKSVETSQYQNISNAGTISLSGFNYEGPEMAKPFKINQATIAFNPNQIKLNEFDAKTGDSDIQVTGALDNFYGFMFKNQVLKGNFNMNSNKLVVSDFMAPTTTTTEEGKKTTEAVKIPSFLDCSLTAKANTVVYDNLNLKDVSGNLVIKDEAIALNNLKMGLFGGQIGLTGTVSTKGTTPKFNMNLGLNALNVAESFTQIDMLKSIAPIANTISGKLNSTINLSGDLTNDMTPNLKTLSGDLLGQLVGSKINANDSKLLTALGSNVKFVDVSKLNLDDVKAVLSFKDGKVAVKPFDIKYQDIKMQVGGTHGFDQTMDYNIKFDVPAKYLGTDVNKLLAKLTPADAAKIENIPVNAILGGNFNNPKITTDTKQATTNLVTQLVKMQKDKLIGQGTGALTNLLGGNSSNLNNAAATTTDTTKTTTPKTPTKDDVKDGVKNVLGGLLGGKKKKE
ncbi:AsmA family protein [Flavobacterium sp. N2270]|uniref:AsmA family protein n=1 Tax=Flavobacterium sp. N2270 TaxID=2986831 RepID=UPI0022242EF5|nr:AsmA family protein [Flavobacterium sp. N2270]